MAVENEMYKQYQGPNHDCTIEVLLVSERGLPGCTVMVATKLGAGAQRLHVTDGNAKHGNYVKIPRDTTTALQ